MKEVDIGLKQAAFSIIGLEDSIKFNDDTWIGCQIKRVGIDMRVLLNVDDWITKKNNCGAGSGMEWEHSH